MSPKTAKAVAPATAYERRPAGNRHLSNHHQGRGRYRRKISRRKISFHDDCVQYIRSLNKELRGIMSHHEGQLVSFMPSHQQVEQLGMSPLKLDVLTRLSNQHWFRTVSSKTLYYGCDVKTKRKLITDQMMRARILVEVMHTKGLNELRVLDGHGRFVHCFFRALLERGLNPDHYKVHVYDIDDDVHNWHKKFFPTGVKSERKNIMDSLEAQLDRGDGSVFTYLNFCGLSTTFRMYRRNLDKLYDIFEKAATSELVMLSYSVRGILTSEKAKVGRLSHFHHTRIIPNWKKVSQRGKFVTGLLTKNYLVRDSTFTAKMVLNQYGKPYTHYTWEIPLPAPTIVPSIWRDDGFRIPKRQDR